MAAFAALSLALLAACVTTPVLPPGVDVLVRFGNNGTTAWTVAGVQGGSVGNTAGPNPTLTLEVGQRYRLEIEPSESIHPFELVTITGGTSAGDIVLLSEATGVEGSFEDDPEVDFVEDGDVFEFTLTQALADALDGYRCGVHRDSMRGSIVLP